MNVRVAGEGGVEDEFSAGGDEVDGGKAVGKDLHCRGFEGSKIRVWRWSRE